MLALTLLAIAAPCATITLDERSIRVEGGPSIALPIRERAPVVARILAALPRRCDVVAVLAAPATPYVALYSAVDAALTRAKTGVELRGAGGAIPLAAGLGEPALDVVSLELLDDRARVRLLVAGALPAKGSPLAALAGPIAAGGIPARLEALSRALGRPSVLYVGATRAITMSTLEPTLRAASAHWPRLHLTWID